MLHYLHDRDGRNVDRGVPLLRDVWGYEPGPPVAATSSRSWSAPLRRKLGHRTPVVETVRGSGYRLRADWRAHIS